MNRHACAANLIDRIDRARPADHPAPSAASDAVDMSRKLTCTLTKHCTGLRHTATTMSRQRDRMTPFREDLKQALRAAILMAALAGCATTPTADTAETRAPTVVETPPSPPPAQGPPAVAANPMLVAADDYAKQRDERLAVVAKTSNALPAGEQGYYLDVLYAQLRQVLGAHADVERGEGTIRLVLPPTVTFEVASAQLSAEAAAALSAILGPLRDYRSLMISVHGHTDASGPAEVNQRLSAQRALTVAEQLRGLGFPANQLIAIGHGASQPSADNSTAEGRQINRRVELLLEAISATE